MTLIVYVTINILHNYVDEGINYNTLGINMHWGNLCFRLVVLKNVGEKDETRVLNLYLGNVI